MEKREHHGHKPEPDAPVQPNALPDSGDSGDSGGGGEDKPPKH